jgi:hypothetical protein
MKTILTILVTILLAFGNHALTAQCSLIDQQNLGYNGGMSARNLAGYSEWQSFQVTESGMLCKIDVGLFNFMNGTGIFRVYEGIGTAGSILSEDTVLISGDGNFFFPFDVYIPVTAGSNYTFHLIPILGGGLPDPYGVQVQNPGSYSAGEMYIVDPSGSYPTGFDMIFKTYLEINTGMENLDKSQNLFIYPNPSNGIIQVDFREIDSIKSIEIIDVQGKLLRQLSTYKSPQIKLYCQDIPAGFYLVRIKTEMGFVMNKKIIISHSTSLIHD